MDQQQKDEGLARLRIWSRLEPCAALSLTTIGALLERAKAEGNAIEQATEEAGDKVLPDEFWADRRSTVVRERERALETLALTQPAASLSDALLQASLLEAAGKAHAIAVEFDPQQNSWERAATCAVFEVGTASVVQALRQHLGMADPDPDKLGPLWRLARGEDQQP